MRRTAVNRDLWEANVRAVLSRAVKLLEAAPLERDSVKSTHWRRDATSLVRDLKAFHDTPRDGAPDRLKDPLLEALVERQKELVEELKGLRDVR